MLNACENITWRDDLTVDDQIIIAALDDRTRAAVERYARDAVRSAIDATITACERQTKGFQSCMEVCDGDKGEW